MFGVDCRRAIPTAVIYYAVLFLIVSGLMFVPGAYDAATKTWTLWSQVPILVIAFLLAFGLSQRFYFKAKPTKPLNEGFVLGITIAIIAFLIEIPVMAYGFAADMGWNWFTQWNILVGYVLVIIAAIAAAMTKK